MQADVPYAFNAHELLDLLQLATADNRHGKIFEADEPPENFLASLGKPDIIWMPPQTHKRPVEIEQQEPMTCIANARDYLGPRIGQVAHILRCSSLAWH